MRMTLIRELQANSRRTATYWTRTGAAGSVIAVAALFLLTDPNQSNGRALFYTLVTISLILCALDAVTRGGAVIAQEKQDGTFPLLLLTRLTGQEIVFGKFLSAAIGSLQPVIAITPALALAIFLGGISGEEVAQAMVALIYAVVIFLAAGVRCSGSSKTTLSARPV